MCAGLTFEDLALEVKVDSVLHQTELERALDAECWHATTTHHLPATFAAGEQAAWQGVILRGAKRRWYIRDAPLGNSGTEIPVPVQPLDPDLERDYTRLAAAQGIGHWA